MRESARKFVLLCLIFMLSICVLTSCDKGNNSANEDYVFEKDDTSNLNTPSTQPPKESPSETIAPPTIDDEKNNSTDINPDFKAAMDSYEEFFDEYVAIMRKYKENPADLSILTDYSNYMSQYADMMQKLEKWENEDLNAAETAYYIDVQARISKKLLEVAN